MRAIQYDPEELKRLVAEGLTVMELAEHFGCAEGTMHHWKRTHGLNKRIRKTTDPEKMERIEGYLDDGWPFTHIQEQEGVSWQWLSENFPGRQWTQAEAGRHAQAVHRFNRVKM